jgi:PadR family transcriptional regulator AphA
MSRNDAIRLTTTSFIVLGLIDWRGATSPFRMKTLLLETVGDFHPVPHTTFYEEPARLAAAGYLDESQEQSGRRRKSYSLTEKGKRALAEWLADPGAEPTELRSPAMLKVFFGANPGPLAEAALARHRQLLDGFEALRGERRPAAGPGRALEAGIEYHRSWVRIWERLGRETSDR